MTDSQETPLQADKSAPADRAENGPFDATEANPVRPYIDIGGVKVLPRDGLNLRLEVEEKTQRIVAVGLDYAESTLQVQPFAAPRSTGLWHETREQIRAQVAGQGGRVEEREGPSCSRRFANRRERASCASWESTGRAGSCAA
jgi:hypothetical protein